METIFYTNKEQLMSYKYSLLQYIIKKQQEEKGYSLPESMHENIETRLRYYELDKAELHVYSEDDVKYLWEEEKYLCSRPDCDCGGKKLGYESIISEWFCQDTEKLKSNLDSAERNGDENWVEFFGKSIDNPTIVADLKRWVQEYPESEYYGKHVDGEAKWDINILFYIWAKASELLGEIPELLPIPHNISLLEEYYDLDDSYIDSWKSEWSEAHLNLVKDGLTALDEELIGSQAVKEQKHEKSLNENGIDASEINNFSKQFRKDLLATYSLVNKNNEKSLHEDELIKSIYAKESNDAPFDVWYEHYKDGKVNGVPLFTVFLKSMIEPFDDLEQHELIELNKIHAHLIKHYDTDSELNPTEVVLGVSQNVRDIILKNIVQERMQNIIDSM